ALPVGKVGLEAPLAGKLAKGEVRSGPVVFKMTSAQSPTTLVVKGLDRDEKALDVRDPATRTSALLQQLDRAWSGQDWTGAIQALTDLRVIAPDDGIYKDKLYAAYINSADKLTVAGDKGQAAAQLSKAVQLDPTRDEAASRQLALTPTPLPATATPVPAPAAPPNVQQYMNYQVPLLTRASSGLLALGDQSTQAGNNAYVMADPTWRTRTALALSELKSAGQQIQKYEPVPAE